MTTDPDSSATSRPAQGGNPPGSLSSFGWVGAAFAAALGAFSISTQFLVGVNPKLKGVGYVVSLALISAGAFVSAYSLRLHKVERSRLRWEFTAGAVLIVIVITAALIPHEKSAAELTAPSSTTSQVDPSVAGSGGQPVAAVRCAERQAGDLAENTTYCLRAGETLDVDFRSALAFLGAAPDQPTSARLVFTTTLDQCDLPVAVGEALIFVEVYSMAYVVRVVAIRSTEVEISYSTADYEPYRGRFAEVGTLAECGVAAGVEVP